jgi:hypothetical protein
MVDGAHAAGQIEGLKFLGSFSPYVSSVPAIGADFYTTNAHKWLFAPKGSAVLWFDRKWRVGNRGEGGGHNCLGQNVSRRHVLGLRRPRRVH